MTKADIQSIGWLNRHDGYINLTVCTHYQLQPIFIKATKAQYDAAGGDQDKLKDLALSLL